jgi:hypothetical protein
MAAANTLDGRLLCASYCAYTLTNGGGPNGNQADAFSSGAAFLSAPATFVRGVDAALVGTTADGVVLAFRGTLPINQPGIDTIHDWFNDFDALPVPDPNLPGRVHQGFLGSLNNLWDAVHQEVTQQLSAAGAGKPVLITGHSKGGGLAPLAAWRLKQEDVSVQVTTFAAPRPGSSDFADAYHTSRIAHTRYEYADDIVPHLPPIGLFSKVLRVLSARDPRFAKFSTFGYESVGTLQFIDWSGQVVGDYQDLALRRVINLLTMIGANQEQTIVEDHLLRCDVGYVNALCPEVC